MRINYRVKYLLGRQHARSIKNKMNIDISFSAIWQSWIHLIKVMFSGPQGLFWWPTLVVMVTAAIWLASRKTTMQPQFNRERFIRELPTDLLATLGYLVTQAIVAPFLAPIMVGGAFLVFATLWVPAPVVAGSGAAEMVVVALLVYAFGDHNIYWTHRLFHRFGALWRLHRFHHNPQVLTPLTAFRFWPPETLVHMLAFALGEGLAIGFASLVFGLGISPEKLLGVNIIAVAWMLAFSHLRHSHVPLAYPRWLSYVLISPAMHQVHHSVDSIHHDKNFGTAFALWDWLYGTLYMPKKGERISFGLS